MTCHQLLAIRIRWIYVLKKQKEGESSQKVAESFSLAKVGIIIPDNGVLEVPKLPE